MQSIKQRGIKLKNNSIFNIEKSLSSIKTQTNAPVHLWNQKFCGNLDIRIARDGTWFHEGSKINRPKLVKLFSSILKREGNDYFLVTPMEKIGIKVDDAPFLVNSINTTGTGKRQNILFTTNIGETIIVSDDNLLRMEFNHKTNEPSPYVTVRRNLEGLIDRKTFYRLVDLGTIEHYDGDSWFGVWSKNTFFPITLQKNLVD